MRVKKTDIFEPEEFFPILIIPTSIFLTYFLSTVSQCLWVSLSYLQNKPSMINHTCDDVEASGDSQSQGDLFVARKHQSKHKE